MNIEMEVHVPKSDQNPNVTAEILKLQMLGGMLDAMYGEDAEKIPWKDRLKSVFSKKNCFVACVLIIGVPLYILAVAIVLIVTNDLKFEQLWLHNMITILRLILFCLFGPLMMPIFGRIIKFGKRRWGGVE